MKRILLTLALTIITLQGITAQQPLRVDQSELYIGQVAWKQPVTAEYKLTNATTHPLTVTDVETDCACTVAYWNRITLEPGAQTTVTVWFDAKTLGHFNKSVALHTNVSTKPVYVRLLGEVVKSMTDFSRTHPFRMGDLCLDKDEIEFPDVYRGEEATFRLGIANMGTHDYLPVLMHLPSYVSQEATPSVIPPHSSGFITLTLQPNKLTDLGLRQSNVYLSRFVGDKVNDDTEIPLSVVILPNLSGMDAAHAPSIRLSTEHIDLSKLSPQKDKVKVDVEIENEGKGDLRIAKLQVFNPAVGVSLRKSHLKAGERTRLRITVNHKSITPKKHHLRVLIISNDPHHPKKVIELK
jgi:hypothetical protein